MEGLDHGWIKSRITGLYHYHRPSPSHRVEQRVSICSRHKINDCEEGLEEFLELVEVLDQNNICPACKRLVDIKNQSERTMGCVADDTIIPCVDEYKLVQRRCDEEGCKETGIAFIRAYGKEKPHYCIKHNPRIPKKKSKITA